LKYLGGYITAGILGAITWVLLRFGEQFSSLVDMVYPYVIRTLQAILAQWSGGVDFLIWQLLAIVLVVVFLAALVLVIVFKRSIISWAGWVLATLTGIYLLHTLVYGMNYYAGPLADDIRMEVAQYTLDELADALSGGTLEEIVEAQELGRAIDRFLDTLNKENRILFLRRYWFGDSVQTIAKMRGMTENSVSVRLNRIRSKLRNYLTEEEFL
jgi:RNA polymerase sigma factor (sigma-70 family)